MWRNYIPCVTVGIEFVQLYALVVVQVIFLARRRGTNTSLRVAVQEATLKWLPIAMVTSFLVFPSVSALAEERKRVAPPGEGVGSGGPGSLRFGNHVKRSQLRGGRGMLGGRGGRGMLGGRGGGGMMGRGAAAAAAAAGSGAPDPLVAVHESLDDDGVAPVGTFVREGEPICCVVNDETGETHTTKHKESEPAFVQTVRALGPRDSSGQPVQVGGVGGSYGAAAGREKGCQHALLLSSRRRSL